MTILTWHLIAISLSNNDNTDVGSHSDITEHVSTSQLSNDNTDVALPSIDISIEYGNAFMVFVFPIES